jgi:kumamolisin
MDGLFRSYITTSTTLEPSLTITDAVALGYITPPMIASCYNIPANAGGGVKVGIISLGGGILQSDLNSGMADIGLTAPIINVISVDGVSTTFAGGGADEENTLDCWCVASMVPNATINMYVAPNSNQGFVDCMTQAVNDNCDVISVSWGGSDNGGSDYMSSILATAVSKGITIFIASGDNGSYDGFSSEAPQYPASSSNVVAVGGTLLSINPDFSRNYEFPSQQSGGGISTIISRPTWQNGLTYKTYNSATQVVSGPFSLGKRGVPDIAAPFYNYVMYFNGGLVGIGGTSAAAPVMAGMMARFIALSGGKRPAQGSVTMNNMFYKNVNKTFYNSTFNFAYSPTTQSLVNNDDYNTSINGYVLAANTWTPVTGVGVPIGNALYRLFELQHTANTFPIVNKSSRPSSGQSFPRQNVRVKPS